MVDVLTVGSLFSGIGGLDLGLERAGMTVRWQVENDPYCQRVLAKHWPDVPRYGDIKELDPHDLESVDLICGGFPCQPVSLAGRGRAQEDDRWLWPEYARIVHGVRPRFVLVENVPGLLVRGVGDVLGDLADLGYDTEWQSIPAAAVGAPHLRWRVFIVAHARGQQHQGGGSAKWGPLPTQLPLADAGGPRRWEDAGGASQDEGQHAGWPSLNYNQPDGHGEGHRAWHVADADSERQQERRCSEPGWWATEPDVGRVAHGVPHRVDRLRGLGNAVVPQVAEYVGRRIVEAAA